MGPALLPTPLSPAFRSRDRRLAFGPMDRFARRSRRYPVPSGGEVRVLRPFHVHPAVPIPVNPWRLPVGRFRMGQGPSFPVRMEPDQPASVGVFTKFFHKRHYHPRTAALRRFQA